MVYEMMFRLFGGLTLAFVLVLVGVESEGRADPGGLIQGSFLALRIAIVQIGQ